MVNGIAFISVLIILLVSCLLYSHAFSFAPMLMCNSDSMIVLFNLIFVPF